MTPSPVGYHGSFVDVDGNDRSQAFRLRGTSALFQRAKSLYATLPRALAPGGRALPPHVYYFEVTRACNLRCQMCQYIDFLENVPVKEQRVGELTTDEWLDVIAQIEPASLVIFSGGELFVRPDMMTILDAATKRARVHFITNGTMLDDARVAELERRFAPRLGRKGINIVSISIDGPPAAHDLIRRKPGGFARTAEGIGRLHAARAGRARRVPMLTTTTVIQPDNVDTLAELPALLAELDIDIMNLATETRVQDLADFGKRAPRDIETSEITWASIERGRLDEALDRTMAAADAAGIELRMPRMPRADLLDFYDGGTDGVPTRLDLSGYDCLTPWFGIAVDPWGSVMSCASYSYGNVREARLADLWNGDRARAFRRTSREGLYDFCPGCCMLEHRSAI